MQKSKFSRLVNQYPWATKANIDTARDWEAAKAATDDYILAHEIAGAWDIVKSIFPELEWKCGADETHYRAYYHGELAADYMYVCVLGNTLELNLPNGETFRVNYRIYSLKPLWEIEREQEAEKAEIREKIGEAELEESKMEEKKMTKQEVVENMADDLETALETYELATTSDIHHGTDFVWKLARSNYKGKKLLRSIFSRHSKWNEREQRVGIPINVPQFVDGEKVRRLVDSLCEGTSLDAFVIEEFLLTKNCEALDSAVAYIERNWAGVYREDAKRTKILSKILKKEGLWEEKQGVFAAISDEVNKKDLALSLYISLNPADFMTMSNPQNPVKGKPFMQSCHSLDSGCEYHCGASGYARDEVSFITYTVAKGDSANRWYKKTNRVMFAFSEGTLLQSRLYTTYANGEDYGGVYEMGDREYAIWDVTLAAVKGVFSECLGTEWRNNLTQYNDARIDISWGDFGGYPDWYHYPRLARVCSLLGEELHNFQIGRHPGLCLECGEEIYSNLYCEYCGGGYETCDDCGASYAEDEGYYVTDHYGHTRHVCQSCYENDYFYCESCGEYHNNDDAVCVHTEHGEEWVCEACAERDYTRCDECGEYHERIFEATNGNGESVSVCESCAEKDYIWCADCEELCHYALIEYRDRIPYCPDCAKYHDEEAEG